MKTLVIGARGQLGSVFVRDFANGHEVIARPRAELDVTDVDAVGAQVRSVQPEVIVNCSAYTDVDGAESDPVSALEVNAFAVRALAKAAQEVSAVLVHFSSDFVFDGESQRPYTEMDRPNPLSTYASSKLLGEWFAQDAAVTCSAAPQGKQARSYVLRVESLFGGPRARSSIDGIIDAISRQQEAPVFVDRTVSPSFVEDVVMAVRTLLARRAPYGVYHCVNTGYGTWYEVGKEIGRLLGVKPRLVGIRMNDLKLPARRPRYCALANDKLRQAGVDMPTWQDALARYLAARVLR